MDMVFSFSVNMPYSTSNHTGLELTHDASSAHIIFKEGAIQQLLISRQLLDCTFFEDDVRTAETRIVNADFEASVVTGTVGHVY